MPILILRETHEKLISAIEIIRGDIKKNSKDIAKAAEFGDLRENAEYESAKEKQAILFSSLRKLERYLQCEIVDQKDITASGVSFGTMVKVFDVNMGELDSFTVVGPAEYELESFPNVLTYTAPLAKALLGKKAGEVVTVKFGDRNSTFVVVEILPLSLSTQSKISLVIIGHVGHDVIFVDHKERSRCIAGSAYYSAVGASRFMKHVGIVTRVGKVDKEILDAIRALGVSLEGIKMIPNEASSEFRIDYFSDNANLGFLARRLEMSFGCGENINYADIPPSFLSAPFVHIASAPPHKQLQLIIDLKNSSPVKHRISIDTTEPFILNDKETLLNAFDLCDIIFLNEREKELLRELRSRTKIVVVKKGKGGAEVWTGNKLKAKSPAPKVKLIDSTGSGDVLAGAFTALMSLNHTEELSLQLAVVIASKSISDFGVDHLIAKAE